MQPRSTRVIIWEQDLQDSRGQISTRMLPGASVTFATHVPLWCGLPKTVFQV